MENLADLDRVLGEDNVWLFIGEIRNGKIDIDLLKMISLKMGQKVHGVFMEKHEKSKPENVARKVVTVKTNFPIHISLFSIKVG